MSTLRVDNLQASDGLSPAFGTGGIAKARGLADQTNSLQYDTDNVSSFTDNATGEGQWDLTNAMDSATNKTLVMTGSDGSGSNMTTTAVEGWDQDPANIRYSAGGVRWTTTSSADSNIDAEGCMFTLLGDLA